MSTKIIKLPAFKIIIEMEMDTLDRPVGGSITSELHEGDDAEYNAAIDAIESIVLGHAMAEIDVESGGYIEGLETAVNACANNY